MVTLRRRLAISESMIKDMRRYAEMDIDELLSKLSASELEQLTSMVDPDDSMIPPSERYQSLKFFSEFRSMENFQKESKMVVIFRCNYQSNKEATGPLNRRKLLKFLENYAVEQEDLPEVIYCQSTYTPSR